MLTWTRTARVRRTDEGMTLVELIVAMLIFSIVMAIMGTAIMSMTRSTVRVNGTGDSTASTERLFNRLDKQVPYARGINPVGQVGDRWYVEFLTEVQAGGYPPGCWQYRFDESDRRIDVRRASSATPVTVGAWTTVTTDVVRRGPTPDDPTDVDAPPPFTTFRTGTSVAGAAAAADGLTRQRLNVAVQVVTPGTPSVVLDTTWVARNSTPKFESEEPLICDGMPRT